MRQLLRLAALLLAARALHRAFFGPTPDPDLPPLIDEVEALERRLRPVLPGGWTLERRPQRPWDPGPAPLASRPYLEDWARAWVLSAPWPGHEPQRAQVHLFLLRDTGGLSVDREMLARWERFSVAAQDPAAIAIGNDRFTWATLPGWPTARADIIAALA